MDLYGGGYGRFFESRKSALEWAVVRMTIGAGQMLSSRPRDCSPWLQPGNQRVNPDEETTDWRAVCGKIARTVRRAGTAKAVSDPYHPVFNRTDKASARCRHHPPSLDSGPASSSGQAFAGMTDGRREELVIHGYCLRLDSRRWRVASKSTVKSRGSITTP
jgi:hypothetical protein